MVYAALYTALKEDDHPMILRYLTTDLYDQYSSGSLTHQLSPSISDIVIMNGKFVCS